ncbi:MAG: hypothetical protein HYT20_03135 [Candidatus Nealsonbacteria bacterium]|nr:hypothetical protein [Candidatus Nealsonbacteria bacterium]
MIAEWFTATTDALINLWQGFLGFIPSLIGAVLIFVVGWIISVAFGRLVAGILKKLRFNQIFEKGVWKEALMKAEVKVDASGFVGAVVKWVLVIVFLMVAVEILGLVGFAGFLNNVLGYVPNVIIASFIFVVAVIVADLLEKVVRATVESIKVGYGHIVGVIVRWSIWIFALLAILMQLQITPALIQTIFTGFIALVVIAGGIAFGLGGKEVAGEIVKDMYRKLKG